MYSAAVGSLNSRFAVAKIGVGVVASTTSGDSLIGISFSSVGGVGVGVDSSSSCSLGTSTQTPSCVRWAVAATSYIRASENAPAVTRLISTKSAFETTIVPFLSYLNAVGMAPTETASIAPMVKRAMASFARVLFSASFATNIIPSSVETRSVTKPIGNPACSSKSFGAGPVSGSEPGRNLTTCPPRTVASTFHGTAKPEIDRFGVSALSAAASMETKLAFKWIIRFLPFDRALHVARWVKVVQP